MKVLTGRAKAAIMKAAEQRGVLQRLRAKQDQIAVAGRYSPYYAETPLAAQRTFIEDDQANVILYGGQVGGGKTAGLLMRAARGVHDSQYTYLVLRKTLSDMSKPGGILDLARRMFRESATWVEKDSAMVFESGARIVFGPCENLRDAQNRYQGPAFTGGIGIDEAGLIKWEVIEWLQSRIRGPKGVAWKASMDLTANPQGINHDELVEYFGLDPEGKGTAGVREGYRYIPASLYENPYLDHAEYEQQFKYMQPHLRDALLRGSWAVRVPGTFFNEEMFHLVEPHEVPAFWTWVRCWDIALTGTSDKTGSLRAAYDEEAAIEYHEGHLLESWTANEAIKAIRRQAEEDGPGTMVVVDNDNLTRGLVQALVNDHGWTALEYDDENAAVKYHHARSAGRLVVMFIPTKVQNVPNKSQKIARAEDAMAQIYEGRHRMVRSEGADQHIGQLVRLKGERGDADEALDLLGLAYKATRKIGTPRLNQVADKSAQFELTPSEQLAMSDAERRRQARRRLRGA